MKQKKPALFTLAVFCFPFCSLSCMLDRGGEFRLDETADSANQDSADDVQETDSDALPDEDAGADADDAFGDSSLDVAADTTADVVQDAADEIISDAVTADVVPNDAVSDTPEDAPADAADPVFCFGVPTEDKHVMICADLPGGTAKSLVLKAEIIGTGSTQDIPFKNVCWSEVGVAELVCFPCPGPNICWPVPPGGFPHVSVQTGDKIKFQPGIADAPGGDMKNTLCELGACYQGRYTVYSGHQEVCRVNPDGTKVGATYEGTGTDVKIVCTL